MPFQEINVSTYIGAMSPHNLSLAVNTVSAAVVANATEVIRGIGVVKAPPPQGKVRLVVQSDGVYGSGESLAVVLRWQNPADGTIETPAIATLDAATIPGAGTFEFEVTPALPIPVGAVLSFSNTYTAGTPNDPSVSLAAQLF